MGILKILWICHFTNAEVQTKLPLWKKLNESAPWIPNMIKGFEGRDDIELHVISPHNWLKRQTTYTQNNIHYYFIPYGIPLINRSWPGIFPYYTYTNYEGFRRKVKKIVAKINPDIINLFGAENSYYSSSILDFKDQYPIFIIIQGFSSQLKDVIPLVPRQRKNIAIEEKILKEFKYFGGEQDSSTFISDYNPTHQFYRLYFPVNEELACKTSEQVKKYDCIYYGLLSKIKGTEDFIKVIAELKKTIPDIKACIVGGGDQELFRKQVVDLGCTANIEFKGFVKTQKELFEYVKASKVFLAPPHKERLSMTIREAMYLKVPIVAYATGGIPYINESDENIYMVETGDYIAMAEKALLLLNNESSRLNLAEKAYQYALNEYSLTINTQRLISAIKEITEAV